MRLTLQVSILALALGGAVQVSHAQSGTQTAATQTVAQQGSVTGLSSEVGSVIVIRDGQPYSLAEGDALFEGDIIQTRPESAATPGTVTLTVGGCEQVLQPGQQIVVNAAFCNTPAAALTAEQITILGGVTAPPVGAAGIIAGAVAAAGAAAAATGDDDDGGTTPVSPG